MGDATTSTGKMKVLCLTWTGMIFVGVLIATEAALGQQGRNVVSPERLLARCNTDKMSQVEKASCYERQYRDLSTLMNVVERDYIRSMEESSGEVGHPTKEETDRWKLSFVEVQASWREYAEKDCKIVEEFDSYGGNGGALFGLGCRIERYARRVNEIRRRP